MDLTEVQARCGSKDNLKHKPGGGKVRTVDHLIIMLSSLTSASFFTFNVVTF